MSGFFGCRESSCGSQEDHGSSQRLLSPQERTEKRSLSRRRMALVEAEVEESGLLIPKKMAQLLETDSNPDATIVWYSAEKGQEMCADALEELGEEQDKDCLRDLIANLCPSTLVSLQDVSQAEKLLRCIHRKVEKVCTEPGQLLLRSMLGLLSECCPEETVRSLLRISPSCDNAALAMWEMLLSLPSTSETILDRLLSVIQGWRPNCAIPSASQVLYRLSQQPHCQRILEGLFPRLLMTLIYKLSLAAVMLGQEQPGADQPGPLGLSVEGIKVLLHAAGCEGHVQNIQKEGGWDMMLRAETQERGVRLLAREMRKSPAEQQAFLFQHMKEIVAHRREWQLNYAMTFYTELLGCQGLRKDRSDLRILRSYLSHGSQTIRLRALEGLVALSRDLQMAREMRGRSLLDRILRCLGDPSTDVRMEALVFFQTMMGQLKRKEASPVALLLAQRLPPLFGDESSQVQVLSLSLFGDTMKAVVSRDKAEMKEVTRSVMVSLFLHMNAESRSVAEASGKTLLICAKFLGWRKLKRVIKKKKTWLIGETLVKQDRSSVEDNVCFSLHYLWDSQASMRIEAIRFIGTAARHLGWNQSKRTLEVVWDALSCLDYDPDPSVRSLASQTLRILQSVRELERSRWSFRGLCFCCR